MPAGSDLAMLTLWIRWFTGTLIALGVFFLFLYLLVRSPASLIISGLMLIVFLPIVLFGLWASKRGQSGAALGAMSFCCWMIALMVAARGHTALPAALPLILLPVIFALPYVDRKALLKFAVGALVVSAVASALTIGEPLLASRIDETTLAIIMVPIIAVATGLAIFGLWYVGSALRSSLRVTETMNRRLAESERELERKIRNRTGELEEAVSELSDIHEIARAVNVTLDLGEVITAMQSALQRLLSFDSLSVLLLDATGRRLLVDHVAGIELDSEKHRRILVEGVSAVDEGSIVTAALARKHPILLSEIGPEQLSDMSPTDRQLYEVNPVRSLLVCPLEFAGSPIGLIFLARRADEMKLSEDEVNRIQRYITPLAIVIRNARLLEEAEIARSEAIEASQAKSQFLANMSHELRTPLNAIIGYCEILAEEAEEEGQEEYLEDLEKIRSSGHYLLELISGVLDLTRIEVGKVDLSVEEFEVAELLEEVVDASMSHAEKQGNTLILAASENLGKMHSDSVKVRQILLNLLGNACKFTHDGNIRLEAKRQLENGVAWLEFKVIDDGIGMTAQQTERIFEAFTQADESASRRYGGTGLGLTISREFCALLGGSIGLESEEAKGSSFSVRLPVDCKVAA